MNATYFWVSLFFERSALPRTVVLALLRSTTQKGWAITLNHYKNVKIVCMFLIGGLEESRKRI
jgi:hypothetical protein